MLELFHCAPAPDATGILMVLREKGLDFTSHVLDVLSLEHQQAPFLRLSPLGRSPVLVHDGNVLDDPVLLPEYVEEAFPGPALAPRDAAGWYDVQEWIRFADAEFNDAVNALGWHQVTWPGLDPSAREAFLSALAAHPAPERKAGWAAVVQDAESTEDRLGNARDRVSEAMVRVEGALAANDWLVGRTCTLADLCLYAWVRCLPVLLPGGPGAESTPGTWRWMERLSSRPAVRAVDAMLSGHAGRSAYLPR